MQLGTRWNAGAEPPSRLSAEFVAAIREVEARLLSEQGETKHAGPTRRWTLTWLESRPIAELDDGTSVTLDSATGAVVIEAATES